VTSNIYSNNLLSNFGQRKNC